MKLFCVTCEREVKDQVAVDNYHKQHNIEKIYTTVEMEEIAAQAEAANQYREIRNLGQR